MEDIKKYTPMIQQYIRIKEDYADAVVFFRLGDFYEMFFDDAILASKVLEIALTSRDAGERIPMCGIPYHAAKSYINKLVSKGFKIAIAEQVSEPGNGLVEREVVKLITPGMIIDDEILNAGTFNFIGAVTQSEYGYILAYTDISTGDTFLIDGLNKSSLLDEITNLNLKEVVLKNKSDKSLVDYLDSLSILISIYANDDISNQRLLKNLETKVTKEAASLLLNYLYNESKQQLIHLLPFTKSNVKSFMHLDRHVLEHLELTDALSKNPKSTLIHWIDKTKTAMGSRLLRYYLTHPLKEKDEIEKRYDYIEAFREYNPRIKLEEVLDRIYDINRLVGRIASNNTNARDFVQLRNTLENIPELKEVLSMYNSKLINSLNEQINTHDELYQLLNRALLDNPPILVKDGGMIKDGFDSKLDELRNIASHGVDWLNDFLEQEKERTGIKNLKIGFNRVFGYYLEVTRGNIDLIKDEFGYIRKQTLANAERYITDDLKKQEDKLLNAKEKSERLEYEIFLKIKDQTNEYVESLLKLAKSIALIDTFLSLALVADQYRYIRPKLNELGIVDVELARHPVVERHVEFVANNIKMEPNEMFILTGPNMSGKSTYMRMFAVMVIMAQSGMYVPAASASLPIYDAIFTRIGASDDIAGGKSTFMVEMTEANEALSKATDKSLILFDEIGRGTATYDGMALAQGMIEYIHNNIKSQTLFSTHYHELTKISSVLKRVTNLHVKAKEEKDKMVFLYQVEPGAIERSYGIQVAALANLPAKIINRSKQILKQLEAEGNEKVIDLFAFNEETKIEHTVSYEVQEILDEIDKIDINEMTPLDALIKLKYLQNLKNKKETKNEKN